MRKSQPFILAFVAILMLFASCSTHKNLSPSDRSSIDTVSISNVVEMPDDMYYLGPGNFDYVGGALDYLLASAIYHTAVDVPEELKGKPKEVYKLIMANNEIEVNDIVLRAFIEKITQSDIFNITDQKKQGHRFTLEVVVYGLANPHGLSSRLKPMLGVRGRLFDENGQNIIWEKYAYVTNLNDETPSNESEELLKNPELIREAFTSAAQIVCSDLVNDLVIH